MITQKKRSNVSKSVISKYYIYKSIIAKNIPKNDFKSDENITKNGNILSEDIDLENHERIIPKYYTNMVVVFLFEF